jgi:hypothetical protein
MNSHITIQPERVTNARQVVKELLPADLARSVQQFDVRAMADLLLEPISRGSGQTVGVFGGIANAASVYLYPLSQAGEWSSGVNN